MTHVFYASQAGAVLDSDVLAGGGTDDTAALQAVLDQAPALGWLHLIIDGAALVHGLNVYSNTTIEGENSVRQPGWPALLRPGPLFDDEAYHGYVMG